MAINLLLACSVLLVLGVVSGLAWLLRQIRWGGTSLPITADWITELSAERYRPMSRLLQLDDLTVLQSQPGFTAAHASQFRTRRAQVFRGYLRCLHADFSRISIAIRVLMVQSRDDRPDLARLLVRRRALYAVAAAMVHARLWLYERGICGVDPTGLMRTFEALRLELHALLPGRLSAQP